jgi:uncharacterized protein YydD (DUF2326 family)
LCCKKRKNIEWRKVNQRDIYDKLVSLLIFEADEDTLYGFVLNYLDRRGFSSIFVKNEGVMV